MARLILLPVLTALTVLAPSATALTTYDPQTCQITGDGDLYGLGVRLGLYMTWLGTVFTACFKYKQYGPSLLAFNVLTTAMLIAAWVGFFDDSVTTMPSVEAYIVSSLIVGLHSIIFIAVLMNLVTSASWGRLPKFLIVAFACFFEQLVLVGTAAVNLKLFFKFLPTSAERECDPKVFFFTSVSVYSWYTTFSKVIWVIDTVSVSIFAVLYSIVIIACIGAAVYVKYMKLVEKRDVEKEWLADEEDVDRWEKIFAKVITGSFFFFILLASGITSIVFAEKTIQINGITFGSSKITNSGQLIALLVGCLTLATAIVA